MKQTFSKPFFNWILIAITVVYSVSSVARLFSKFEDFSSYFLRIFFALISLTALISLIAKNTNGERYAKFFILTGLIAPSVIFFNQYLTDLLFYGANRLDLIQNPLLYLNLIFGIVLFIGTLQYSKQTKSDQIKDYSILINSIGVFIIILMIIRTIQPHFLSDLNKVQVWEIIFQTIIGSTIIYLGYRLKNQTMKLKTCLIITVILLFIYGVV